jgi:hypothetical protein
VREHKTTDGGGLLCDELAEVVADQYGNTWIWSPSLGAFEKHARYTGEYFPPSSEEPRS